MSDFFVTVRDPFLSLYQSAVAEVAKRIDEKAPTGRRGGPRARLQRSATSTLSETAGAIAQREYRRARGEASVPSSDFAPRELTKLGIAQVCAEWALRYLKALANDDDEAISRLKNEYTAGTCDTAWLTTLEEYRRYFGTDGKRKPIPYIRPTAVGPKTITIKSNARIGLMGDWGTGADPAIEVLKFIAGHKPDVLVHLGDIYYSGTLRECKVNFLNLMNLILPSTVPVFTLSGNHDMYCGGVGFYELIKEINAAPFTQPASFFCLRAADGKWQLLAMDTGLHDDNPAHVVDALTYLEEDELSWHCDRIQEFPGRTILFSHHQLFSAFSAIGPGNGRGKRSATNPLLLKAFQRMAASKKIAAWFWGHEHTLSIYKPFAGLDRGRCLGHGAVPVAVVDEIYKPLTGLEETPSLIARTQLAKRGGVYAHGYALMALEGEQCGVSYYQTTERGRDLVYQESF